MLRAARPSSSANVLSVMQRPDDNLLSRRDWKFESCEERLAMSADAIADFWIDYTQTDIDEYVGPVVPLAAEGHGWSDVVAARSDFGLRGGRQTVAIIDSGIAYDHVALGGGLGKAYRVVGGWDFAENDANPYDDGPAGYHGTHVAGIVGAQDSQYAGVAPEVDLVALRVFDDQGQGQFTWVENALRWVHQNRTAFENPITTVNISLGTDWNSTTLPKWATFEDELKQLADDGIFISVAAGNSFLVYGAPGLSYPAVSQHVTPVASVDANGNLSRYSQRAERVLAAPGERVMSTLPDHFYGGDGNKNDWGATSGTSMASPYVAGAAVLVREAMQNLGMAGITQTTIYDRLKSSADTIYDAATSTTYRRVNLQRALDSLVGADESTTSTDARILGSLTTNLQVSGTLGRVSDQDFFRFTAAQSGFATLTLNSSSQLAATWQAAGGVGQVVGNKLTIQVQAGQSYVAGVAGGGETIGKYSVDLRLTPSSTPGGSAGNNSGSPAGNGSSTIVPVPWGSIDHVRRDNVNLRNADNWYQITAGRTGILTVEALFQQSGGNIDLEIYDSQKRLIASSTTFGHERIDLNVTAGGTYFVRARGSNSDVDFRLTNLVAINDSSTDIAGTSGDDSFVFDAQARSMVVNGVHYSAAGAANIRFDGRGGNDNITLVGGSASESAVLRPGSVQLVGGGIFTAATNVESTHIVGNRFDRAVLYDSAGRDTLEASATATTLTGPGFRSTAEGFGTITVHSTWGSGDFALLTGSAGNDTLTVWAGIRHLQTGGTQIRAENFDSVRFFGGTGWDTVDYYATGKQGWLGGRGPSGWVYNPGFITEFGEVESLLAHVRSKQKLSTDLAALDFWFRKIGT